MLSYFLAWSGTPYQQNGGLLFDFWDITRISISVFCISLTQIFPLPELEPDFFFFRTFPGYLSRYFLCVFAVRHIGNTGAYFRQLTLFFTKVWSEWLGVPGCACCGCLEVWNCAKIFAFAVKNPGNVSCHAVGGGQCRFFSDLSWPSATASKCTGRVGKTGLLPQASLWLPQERSLSASVGKNLSDFITAQSGHCCPLQNTVAAFSMYKETWSGAISLWFKKAEDK